MDARSLIDRHDPGRIRPDDMILLMRQLRLPRGLRLLAGGSAMASTMVAAAREQLFERQRAEAERSEQAHRLLAEHYPGLARVGRPMAERGMRLTWQLTQLGLVLVGLGVALSAFGALGLGAWATGTGLAVALVVLVMTALGARFAWPYDQLQHAVVYVIGMWVARTSRTS